MGIILATPPSIKDSEWEKQYGRSPKKRELPHEADEAQPVAECVEAKAGKCKKTRGPQKCDRSNPLSLAGRLPVSGALPLTAANLCCVGARRLDAALSSRIGLRFYVLTPVTHSARAE
jgi:hypothetical protein